MGDGWLVGTEMTEFRLWYNCAYRAVPVPIRRYQTADGGEVAVYDAPNTAAIGPPDPACEGVQPTQDESNAEVARARAQVARETGWVMKD